VLGVLVPAVLVAGIVAGCSSDPTPTSGASTSSAAGAASSAAPSSAPAAAATPTLTKDADGKVTGLSYAGVDGKTALVLLRQADPTAKVSGSGKNAFVTTIGGRTADAGKHEFWALSVDGKESQVGAGTLRTKDGETISWKIATY
jgi:hypothetical protein